MKKILLLAALSSAIIAGPAQAGRDEIAAGVGGFVLGTIIQDRYGQPRYTPSYPYSPSGYYSSSGGRWLRWDRGFPRFRCRGDQVKCSYEMGVWEREREAFNRAKIEAYKCGRWGECPSQEGTE